MQQRGRKPPPPRKQDAMLCAVPLFHVTGSHSIFLASFVTGRKVCLMYKWDAHLALKTKKLKKKVCLMYKWDALLALKTKKLKKLKKGLPDVQMGRPSGAKNHPG